MSTIPKKTDKSIQLFYVKDTISDCNYTVEFYYLFTWCIIFGVDKWNTYKFKILCYFYTNG